MERVARIELAQPGRKHGILPLNYTRISKYIKHPNEIVSVGDIVTCYVDNVSLEKGKVSLSLINP